MHYRLKSAGLKRNIFVVKEITSRYSSAKGQIAAPQIALFSYQSTLQDEIDAGRVTKKLCLNLFEQMLMVRYIEEMIVEIIAGVYAPLPKFSYIGPTHLSIGQEATAVGAVAGINPDDYITSSHRGHGDAMAKGVSAIRGASDDALAARLRDNAELLSRIGAVPRSNASRAEFEEAALRLHVYRMIAELFGKTDGYCQGVGGSMHIADFKSGHLGANAIVGGHMAIAAGAGISARYRRSGQVTLCMAGDGAYANGISHEAISLSVMAQFENGLMSQKFGVPVIFGIVNNQYGMSGQAAGEVMGVDFLARRGLGYHLDGLHAEVVYGMNVLAVREATLRASDICRTGHGPVLIEFITYRFKGHSLSDPQAYRTKEEVEDWLRRDPLGTFPQQLLAARFPEGAITAEEIEALKGRVRGRNDEMAAKAAAAPDPTPEKIMLHMFAKPNSEPVPEKFKNVKTLIPPPVFKRKEGGLLAYRLAVREALIEEMSRDGRVILFGEDVADYGGAFAVTQGMLDVFGRDRLFNTAIAEAGIVGAAVGMAMTGLRPVCEIMYDDFILMTMDQTGNQAAKWCYMSGGQMPVPMVLRTAIGGGRGYAGQHSQSLESICTHMPGLIVVCPSNAYDAKGLLKSAIRDPNPVVFFEHQRLYGEESVVPEGEFLVPLGKAAVKRAGTDATVVTWGWPVLFALKAAKQLEAEGISLEVVDVRTLWPLDIDTILLSVRKTGRCLVATQGVVQGNFMGEIVSQIVERGFDYLDAPVLRLGAPNAVSPSAQSLEKEYLVDSSKIAAAVRKLFKA